MPLRVKADVVVDELLVSVAVELVVFEAVLTRLLLEAAVVALTPKVILRPEMLLGLPYDTPEADRDTVFQVEPVTVTEPPDGAVPLVAVNDICFTAESLPL
jgi:hypothetical protein